MLLIIIAAVVASGFAVPSEIGGQISVIQPTKQRIQNETAKDTELVDDYWCEIADGDNCLNPEVKEACPILCNPNVNLVDPDWCANTVDVDDCLQPEVMKACPISCSPHPKLVDAIWCVDVVDGIGCLQSEVRNSCPLLCNRLDRTIESFHESSLDNPKGARNDGPMEENDCKCGRIVDGQETEVLEYPWQTAIVRYGTSRILYEGSLINSKWVLSANIYEPTFGIQVLLGKYNLSFVESTEQRFNVSQIKHSPSRGNWMPFNGISLLKLSDEVDFSTTQIRPICLPSTTDEFVAASPILISWGRADTFCREDEVTVGEHGDQCLSFSTGALSWHEAKKACSSKNGRLASLYESYVPFKVLNHRDHHFDGEKFWVGGSDITTEGTWVWLNGKRFSRYFIWSPLDPDKHPNNNTDKNCLMTGSHFVDGYMDEQCDRAHRYICEYDLEDNRVLNKLDVSIFSKTVCTNYYDKIGADHKYVDSEICAGEEQVPGWPDICKGNTGSPLISQVGEHHVQIGVFSGYPGCFDLALYTRVTEFQSWIEENAMTDYVKVCKQ